MNFLTSTFFMENISCEVYNSSRSFMRGDYLKLRAWALDQVLIQAENDPLQLLQVADMTMHDTNRVPIMKRIKELLLKHFSEKERGIFKKKYGTYEVFVITRFLVETGNISLKH